MNYDAILAWMLANPEIWVPAVIYLIWNIVPRTPPANRQLFALWALGERFMFLAWNKFGGKFKALGIVSPSPETWAQEKPTTKDTPTLPPGAQP
jgi:hypothetical protein